ncbi:MAG TPA: hypothetical protein VE733_21710 [Streptosporangiaceae bacterium]|nr:hypothetical protein [Streptosporangiaceae bacterium]
MKGDRVEIVIDTGEGTRTYEVAATRAGRRVDIVNRRGVVEVSEVTRSGTPVRTARFMASRILALVEHPAVDRAERPARGAQETRGGARPSHSGRD